MTRKELARDYFMKGYNCAQSTVVAFKDDLNFPEQFLLNLAAPFGAGFARTRNVCGAVAAMGIIYGLVSQNKSEDIKNEKDITYAKVQKLAGEFISKHGSIICQTLLDGLETSTEPISDERTAQYYKERPCLKFVEDGVEIIEKYLIDNGIINE